MKLDNIKHSAQRLNTIVDGWQTNGEIPRIERDMVLEELRRLYDQLLDIDLSKPELAEQAASAPVVTPVVVPVVDVPAEKVEPAAEAVAPVVEPIAEEPIKEQPVQLAEEEDGLLDIDALLGLSSVVVATTAATAATAADATESTLSNVLPSADEVVETTDMTPAVDAEATEAIDNMPDAEATESINVPEESTMINGELFAMDDIPVSRGNGRKIISIYNTAGMAAATAAATTAVADGFAAPQPTTDEQPKRLADVLAGEKRVLGEAIASEEKPTTPFNRITDLRKAIGINDKFLMIKDLFGGDAVRYEATIDTLNEFEDLDDCMIYIVENFSWNPDSAGAKLLVSLIERKLS